MATPTGEMRSSVQHLNPPEGFLRTFKRPALRSSRILIEGVPSTIRRFIIQPPKYFGLAFLARQFRNRSVGSEKLLRGELCDQLGANPAGIARVKKAPAMHSIGGKDN